MADRSTLKSEDSPHSTVPLLSRTLKAGSSLKPLLPFLLQFLPPALDGLHEAI